MTAFTSSPAYYEAFYNNEARLKREGPFLREMLQNAPGCKVVDMACGTGIHAVFFAELGSYVDAFDISADMIKYAGKHHCHPRITYKTGDMRKLSGSPWDLAVCLGNSLSLVTDSEGLHQTFNAVFSSLAPGGVFVLQILNYIASVFKKPRLRVEHKKVDGADVTAVKILVPHNDKTFLSLSFFSVKGNKYESFAETAVLKNWISEDIVTAAENAGFNVHRLYGGYDRSDFDPENSNDLICELYKK